MYAFMIYKICDMHNICSLSPACVHMHTHRHTHSHFVGLSWIPVQIAALKRLEIETLIKKSYYIFEV